MKQQNNVLMYILLSATTLSGMENPGPSSPQELATAPDSGAKSPPPLSSSSQSPSRAAQSETTAKASKPKSPIRKFAEKLTRRDTITLPPPQEDQDAEHARTACSLATGCDASTLPKKNAQQREELYKIVEQNLKKSAQEDPAAYAAISRELAQRSSPKKPL